MVSSDYIKTLATHIGFDLCGVTRCHKFTKNEQAYTSWLDRGYYSSLHYMRNNLDKRFDARVLVEGAQTVVVCAVSYKSDISGGYTPSDRCKIASYACNRDYHKTIKKMLLQLLKELQTKYPELQGRAFVDSAPILEKQYAAEAGLGWIGRQSLLITPQYGSYILLGELVLCDNADTYDTPYQGIGCGNCRRCIDHCPTKAITEEMVIDTSKCISCRTIEAEQKGRLDLNGWIFGCDECQNCCPYNLAAPMHNNKSFDPIFDPRSITASEWLGMSDDEFALRFGSTPLKRSGLARIKENIEE